MLARLEKKIEEYEILPAVPSRLGDEAMRRWRPWLERGVNSWEDVEAFVAYAVGTGQSSGIEIPPELRTPQVKDTIRRLKDRMRAKEQVSRDEEFGEIVERAKVGAMTVADEVRVVDMMLKWEMLSFVELPEALRTFRVFRLWAAHQLGDVPGLVGFSVAEMAEEMEKADALRQVTFEGLVHRRQAEEVQPLWLKELLGESRIWTIERFAKASCRLVKEKIDFASLPWRMKRWELGRVVTFLAAEEEPSTTDEARERRALELAKEAVIMLQGYFQKMMSVFGRPAMMQEFLPVMRASWREEEEEEEEEEEDEDS